MSESTIQPSTAENLPSAEGIVDKIDGLESKVALVTGGSRGLGAAVCRLAARDGYDVAINYAGREDAARAVAEEVRAFGRKAITIQADIADPAAVEAMFERTAKELGYVSAFVSNAGIINRSAPLADMSLEEIRRVVDVDLTAYLVCNREAVRRMARSRGGSGGVIVNMSSMASELYGAGGFIPYGAAKSGVDVLTIGLGREVAGDGIRVVGLRPGLIDTDIQHDTGIENRLARFGPTVPLGRGGTAEEVAEAVVWLLSDKASYITATLLNVSGGR
ncbi:NAD(P)-dependent dehydrogenase, short-chain alcohol dehydrogenase family [Arboricoccus pini]|uniref:NAD(P)-dependent dehydrogenase, short-chain alcohol dehydrogenase family n=1 Tax=Arboricoccus pini TaxID=1963835 RepID=A0A212QQK8_9PROT|nr:SDR family oxidoreductase [Arboricoccus pini]SNB61720.1 NAD(P)-dependent dehydrogenase, short-chain alcohol dehydrogenase family [Arboricoccus pini]